MQNKTMIDQRPPEVESKQQAGHREGDLIIDIYFAERCSPWQRGANENYNGLLRQYFPKGTDLAVHSEAHVAKVMNELNTRPRRGLNYDTPAARLRAESLRPPGSF